MAPDEEEAAAGGVLVKILPSLGHRWMFRQLVCCRTPCQRFGRRETWFYIFDCSAVHNIETAQNLDYSPVIISIRICHAAHRVSNKLLQCLAVLGYLTGNLMLAQSSQMWMRDSVDRHFVSGV